MARKRDVEVWMWDVGSELHLMNVEMVRSQVSVSTRRYWQPKVDVFELSEGFLIIAEVAGVRLEDISLVFNSDSHSLRIRGSRPDGSTANESKVGIYQLEILCGEFEREIRLPRSAINSDEIDAQLKDGLLRIRVPKLQHAKE